VALVEEVFGVTIDYFIETDPADETPIVDATYLDDRGAALSDLAAAAGAWALFDAAGDFRFVPRAPDPPPGPVATIGAGVAGALLSGEEALDRSSVRNGVYVRGQADSDSAPFWALATHDDPDSPIRWGGPFGKVAMLVESQSVADVMAAQATADALLRLRLGLARTLTLTCTPNPTLAPGDAVTIVHADGRSEVQVINRIELPLGAADSMQVTVTATIDTWAPAGLSVGATLNGEVM
jgi:hypothetical protein